MCGAFKNDSVYNDATLALKALSDACAVVAGSLLHNLIQKNEKAILE